MVIQVPIRHTELKYESDGGALLPGHKWGIFKWPSGSEIRKTVRSSEIATSKRQQKTYFKIIMTSLVTYPDCKNYQLPSLRLTIMNNRYMQCETILKKGY